MVSTQYITKTQHEGSGKRNRQGLLHWLLASLFVAQALVPIQSHTVLQADGKGHVKQVCTLHLDAARGDLPQIQPDASAAPERSAAVDFSLLLTAALDTHAEVVFDHPTLCSAPPSGVVPVAPALRLVRHGPIRAPPGLS